MALGSRLITVRRLEKYIDDVIGKKANLPDTSKTIIGNISQINSDLPFYDTTNVTPIGSYENPIKTYTATFDCIACCRIVTNLSLGQVEVKVNNETIYAQYNASNSIDILNWVSVPLKKGQTVTITGLASDNYIAKVIGVGK